MASATRDLAVLLDILGITEEGLAEVSEQQVDTALQKEGIYKLEECRRVRNAWKRQQQRSGVLLEIFSSSFFPRCFFLIFLTHFLDD